MHARAALRPLRRTCREAHAVVRGDVVLSVLVEAALGAAVRGRRHVREDAVAVLADRWHLGDALQGGPSAVRCGGADEGGRGRGDVLILW